MNQYKFNAFSMFFLSIQYGDSGKIQQTNIQPKFKVQSIQNLSSKTLYPARSRQNIIFCSHSELQHSECFELYINISGNDFEINRIKKGPVMENNYFLIKVGIFPLLNKYFVCVLLRITTKYYVLLLEITHKLHLFN